MNWKSTATLGVVGGTLVTLLATASTSIVRQPETPAPAPSVTPMQGAALAAEIARLHERLRPQVPPSSSTRNPFEFGRALPASRPPASGARPVTGLPALDGVPAAPPFTLVGLAEDQGPAGPVMTAILSSPGALLFVKEGDRVDGGYRVAAIAADSVELRTDDGRPLSLRLK